jgi:hypothetical protein
VQGVEGGLAADPATRGGEEVALQPIEVQFDLRRELDLDDVARLSPRGVGAAEIDSANLPGVGEDALGEQESSGPKATRISIGSSTATWSSLALDSSRVTCWM